MIKKKLHTKHHVHSDWENLIKSFNLSIMGIKQDNPNITSKLQKNSSFWAIVWIMGTS
jgi:hypothetical protein